MSIRLESFLMAALLLTAGCSRHDISQGNGQEGQELSMKTDVAKKLDAELRRFRDENGLSESELAEIISSRAAGHFRQAWFRKGGLILVDDAYQSRYYGDRNVVLTKAQTGGTWASIDVGGRDEQTLVALAQGRVLGAVTIPPGVELSDMRFLLFEPNKVSVFSGTGISGEFFPREPSR